MSMAECARLQVVLREGFEEVGGELRPQHKAISRFKADTLNTRPGGRATQGGDV